MIKDKYKTRRVVEDQKIELYTDTEFTKGKRRGVLSIEKEALIFREMTSTRGKRSKQIARTAHFSVLERPDGMIAGTFRFDPSRKKIKGELSAEFWQAISIALNLQVKEPDEQSKGG